MRGHLPRQGDRSRTFGHPAERPALTRAEAARSSWRRWTYARRGRGPVGWHAMASQPRWRASPRLRPRQPMPGRSTRRSRRSLPTQRLTPRRVTALALASSLVLIAVAGAVALRPASASPDRLMWQQHHRQPRPRYATVVLPDEPPLNSGCSGAVIGHSDVKHPQLGMVRVFLFFDGSMSAGPRSAGCALPVTHTGRVLPTIAVDAFVGNGFGFANPATDATGNMFIKYETQVTATTPMVE